MAKLEVTAVPHGPLPRWCRSTVSCAAVRPGPRSGWKSSGTDRNRTGPRLSGPITSYCAVIVMLVIVFGSQSLCFGVIVFASVCCFGDS